MYNIKSFKGFNWIGFFTLYKKEVKRFFNVFAQTILAPAVTTILFYLIFTLSMDRNFIVSGIHSYSQFLAPGLICMSIMQNAFANTSSSILISKVQGNIVDILMPPVSEKELILAYSLGGMTRGVLVGIVVAFTIYLFVPGSIFSIFHIFFDVLGTRDHVQGLLQALEFNFPSKMTDSDAYVSSYVTFRRF